MDAETLILSLLIGATLYSSDMGGLGLGQLNDSIALSFLRYVDNERCINTLVHW